MSNHFTHYLDGKADISLEGYDVVQAYSSFDRRNGYSWRIEKLETSMPIFLNEVWLGDIKPDLIEEAVTFFGNLSVGTKPDNLPPDLRMVAGPWLSAEEAKVMFIFEIDDPSTMFDAYAERVVSGLFARRKLTLLSDWDQMKTYAGRTALA